eukprot:1124446-Pleurochrysis_carterae.AAC.8
MYSRWRKSSTLWSFAFLTSLIVSITICVNVLLLKASPSKIAHDICSSQRKASAGALVASVASSAMQVLWLGLCERGSCVCSDIRQMAHALG